MLSESWAHKSWWLKAFAVVAAAAMLSACSNSDDDDDRESDPVEQPPPPPPPTGGTLLETPPARLGSFSAGDLTSLIEANSISQEILELIVGPECGVDVHQIRYNTVDPAGQPTTASGALMIPTGTSTTCTGGRPIVLYAHGTSAEKNYNIANLSNPDNAEGLLIAATFASQGYIVVAPNYAGFDTSTLTYHPYLHADQQSRDMWHALTAARSALPTSFAPTITDNGKLFITGYSQGGHVAMATHRLLQQNGVTVTGSAPMSGPYAMAAFGDAVFQGQVIGSAPLLVSWAMTAYQRAYGNIYTSPADAFDARYAPTIESLLPTTGTRSQIFDQGQLPRQQLFSSTPPDPSYAAMTPATSPADLAPVFALGFGSDALINNSYRLSYLQDAAAHPDGGFPAITDAAPAAAPANNLRIAFKANDLRNWVPTSPVLLCAGNDDPTVLYINTDLIRRYWSNNGVTSSVHVLDLDDGVSLGDPDAELKAAFGLFKESVALAAVAGGATDGGRLAVAEAYHTTLVPPFCLSAVQSFFDGL